ncbi:fumarate hydratase [Candidatus Geothermarchaeota archaeon]|nr:MAG: fumarate hydratase [Candidatus Geothermarchaeota archaeon]
MAEYHLRTPISEIDVRRLSVWDVVYITGEIYTARDAAHKRMIEYLDKGLSLPVDLKNSVVYHCGPLIRRKGREWKVIAAGPTTSMRMEAFSDRLIGELGVKLIIGKGGMGKGTVRAARKYHAAYGVFTGGAAVLASKAIKRVKDVKWLDLGMPEAIWVLEVKEFGPIIITIDSHGNNVYEKVKKEALARLKGILTNL